MKKAVVFGGLLAIAPGAFADLILLNGGVPLPSTGNGVGHVDTILSVQHQGNSIFESGCVTASGRDSDCMGGITAGGAQPGANTPFPLMAIPTGTLATDLRFLFNASETQNKGGAVTLNQLSIGFYSTASGGAGSLLHVANYIGPTNLTDTLAGTGNAGFVFGLNPTEAGTVQGFLNGGSVFVGAGLSAGCSAGVGPGCIGVSGGPERVQMGFAGRETSSVPEPGTLALLGIGLGTTAAFRLRRRRA